MSKNKAKQADQGKKPEDVVTQEGADAKQADQGNQPDAKVVRMTHDEIASFSMSGREYKSTDGVFDLPHDVAVYAVKTWGFVAVAESAAK